MLRGDSLWMDWASSSLPVPLSPVIRTVKSDFAMRLASSTQARIRGEWVMTSSKV